MIFNSKKILLWGGKSQAKLIEGLVADYKIGQISVVYDANLRLPYYQSCGLHLNCLSLLRKSMDDFSHFVVAIGAHHGYARDLISERLIALGKKPLSIIHHAAQVDKDSVCNYGSQIMANVVVNKYAKLGRQVILNTSCVIEHEVLIGNGVHVMPGAVILGRAVIDDYCTIGANATILPDIRVGRGAIIGAGAVVIENVEPNAVVGGVPARKIKQNNLVFDESQINPLFS